MDERKDGWMNGWGPGLPPPPPTGFPTKVGGVAEFWQSVESIALVQYNGARGIHCEAVGPRHAERQSVELARRMPKCEAGTLNTGLTR
eukprot:332695-Chlamydomonas_euryale.AAC.2